MLEEITIFARAGQGAITASNVLARAAFIEGRYAVAFPMFGVERSGSPMKSFVRISDKKVSRRDQICSSDYVIILDNSLLDLVETHCGMPKKKIIANCEEECSGKKMCVNASKIAMDTIGRPFVNIAMVGAFAKVSGFIKIESVMKAIEEVMKGKKPEMIEKNKEVAKKVFIVCKIK